jgi:hypothetical protein
VPNTVYYQDTLYQWRNFDLDEEKPFAVGETEWGREELYRFAWFHWVLCRYEDRSDEPRAIALRLDQANEWLIRHGYAPESKPAKINKPDLQVGRPAARVTRSAKA